MEYMSSQASICIKQVLKQRMRDCYGEMMGFRLRISHFFIDGMQFMVIKFLSRLPTVRSIGVAWCFDRSCFV